MLNVTNQIITDACLGWFRREPTQPPNRSPVGVGSRAGTRRSFLLLFRDRAVALGALIRGVIVRNDGDHVGLGRDGCDGSGRNVGRVDVVIGAAILRDDTLAVLVPNLSLRALFDHDAAADTVLFHRGRRAVRTCEATISRVLQDAIFTDRRLALQDELEHDERVRVLHGVQFELPSGREGRTEVDLDRIGRLDVVVEFGRDVLHHSHVRQLFPDGTDVGAQLGSFQTLLVTPIDSRTAPVVDLFGIGGEVLGQPGVVLEHRHVAERRVEHDALQTDSIHRAVVRVDQSSHHDAARRVFDQRGTRGVRPGGSVEHLIVALKAPHLENGDLLVVDRFGVELLLLDERGVARRVVPVAQS